jgi:CTP:molybdopterin cytidylyltransferase MocA
MNGISAILLAAGAGSRFGGGKLLAELDGRPLIEHTLAALREAPVDDVVAVISPDADRLREVCGSYEVRIVENPEWAKGQSTSVKAGIRAMGPEARAAVVMLGDQPLVGPEAMRRLVAAFENGARMAVATYGGKRRNPALFSRELWPLLLEELSGDEGARRFMRHHGDLVVEISCDEAGNPADVDTKEDLRRLEGSRRRVSDYKIG